jgi:glucose/arabinose dehydrogenase
MTKMASSIASRRAPSRGGTPSATLLALGALYLGSCDLNCASTPPAQKVLGKPVETRPPEGETQKPARSAQTRAPYQSFGVRFDVQRVKGGLEHPWGLAFLPNGKLLVTERPGRLRVVLPDGAHSEPVSGVPKVDAGGQGGLLDVALDPKHAENGLVYLSYAEPRPGGNGTSVARGRLAADAKPPRLEDVRVVWRQEPALDSDKHFGSRLVFARDGNLFVTTGERYDDEGRVQAQRLDSGLGKVIRIRPDGSVPEDNPFRGRAGAQPEIYSYGHRNIQSAAIHPGSGKLWIVEHGARGGDELNVLEPGKNYGWPVITYGVEYSGRTIGEGKTQAPGMEQPAYYWDPVIAPSGMAFYEGNAFPAWRGSLFVGGLVSKHVVRLSLEGTRVTGEERLLEGRARFRDVRVGPGGLLYLLTDADDGEILRLVPQK